MAEKDLYSEDQGSGGDTAAASEPAPAAKPASSSSSNSSAGGASSGDALAADLAQRGITTQKKTGLAAALDISIGGPPEAVVTAFLRQLVMLLDAGVPLLRAITTLAERSSDRSFRNVILQVGSRVEGGSTLWQAMSEHPKVFDSLFVNLVKAGETSGTLTTVLSRIAEYRQKKALLRRQVRSAMVYPAISLTIAGVVITLILLIVLPAFEQVFKELDFELPAFTRAALGFSYSLRHYWYLYLIGIAGLIIAWRLFKATPGGRFFLDRQRMRIPVIGGLVTKIVVADFTRTFSSLLGAGVSILETLDLTRDATSNVAFAADLKKVRDSIEQGEGLERPLRESDLMPAIVTDMLVTGEESGALEGISAQVADVYEEEVDAAVLALKNLIEPVMILIIGFIVGGLGLSVIIPLVNLMTQQMEPPS